MAFQEHFNHVRLQFRVSDPLELLESLEFGKRRTEYPWGKNDKSGLKMASMTLTRHNIEHITVVIRPVNPESFDSTREEWVHLDSVEDVE